MIMCSLISNLFVECVVHGDVMYEIPADFIPRHLVFDGRSAEEDGARVLA